MSGDAPPMPPPVLLSKLPKSFQEETRMRQKQVVQFLADSLEMFGAAELLSLHEFLSALTESILAKLYPAEADPEDCDALSWSTPGWLLLHLWVLLRLAELDGADADALDFAQVV